MLRGARPARCPVERARPDRRAQHSRRGQVEFGCSDFRGFLSPKVSRDFCAARGLVFGHSVENSDFAVGRELPVAEIDADLTAFGQRDDVPVPAPHLDVGGGVETRAKHSARGDPGDGDGRGAGEHLTTGQNGGIGFVSHGGPLPVRGG